MNKKIIGILVIIVAVIAIIAGIILSNSNNEGKKVSKEKDQIEIVKELYLEQIHKREGDGEEGFNEKLQDSKINKVTILADGEEKDFAKSAYESNDISEEYRITVNDKDIFAEVVYEIKPYDIENTKWIAGNGVIDGEWIVMRACVYIRYIDGEYKFWADGTGW